MPQHEQDQRTTITVSRSFARILNTLARDAGVSAREYCDRQLAPSLKVKAKKAAERALRSIDIGGEG